ncbi:hypothetical protein L917_21634, partial [Phytophthora nicotianae]
AFELPRSTFQHSALTRTPSSLSSDSSKRQATKKIRSPLLKPWPRLLSKFRAVLPSVVVMEVTMAAPMIHLRRRLQFHLVEVVEQGRQLLLAKNGCGCFKSNSQSSRSPPAKSLKEQAEVQASENCLALARSFTLQLFQDQEKWMLEFAHELELPEKSGYRFYPVVHVSRLKTANEYLSRPKTRLTQDVTEDIRLDFDEELLPEDSWEPDHLAGEYEVETILDNRM